MFVRDSVYEKIIKPALKKLYVHKIVNVSRIFAKSIEQERKFSKFRLVFDQFKKLSENETRFPLEWKDRYICLSDNAAEYFDRSYIYHIGWASRILANTKPSKHTDISSSLYFVSAVSAFVPIEFYEYRPVTLALSNLKSGSADLTSLPFADKSVESLSCMHVVEHIGLGRYGDNFDPKGDLKAMSELQRVTGKTLLFVVPVGKPLIMFNAHRIYSFDQVVSNFKELRLKEFALIPEDSSNGEIIYNPPISSVEKEKYACGCFWFEREII